MSGPLLRSGECRKFAPNIFNKTKCTNCFRQKEEHSAEALESNRATRKVAKCGYLFVAPGWDFTNPLNRTKRWQRRWFVLYDDGELSYSLDEHPETVPQASIDMNKVIEVADAEDVTGNAYSLAITAPDNVHFVKGTCREEARWWSDVLSVFPRSKGRHKRNATFPGGQTASSASTILQSPVRGSTTSYNSCRLPGGVWEGEDVFPTRDVAPSQPSPLESPGVSVPPADNRKVYMGSPPTRDKVRAEEKGRTRRVQNREKRGLKSGRSFSEDLTKMLPSWRDKKTPPSSEHPEVSRRLLLEEFESECKLKDIADSLTRPRHRRLTSPAVTPPPTTNTSNQEPTRDGDTTSHKQVRGDPDGCGLDLSALRYSPSSELRVELPAEDLLNIKKGWLMKQGTDKEWNKHWFVLRGAALLYYRDPSGEDQGILDGVIDLSGVSAVTEVQVARNYGFQTTTWDERSYVLSAVTSGIRANWMSAIRRAAGLDNVTPKLESAPIQIERERDVSLVPTTPLTPRSILFSSDDEYRTASEGGRRESGDWGDALPPSPPLNRTPISKVKERARGPKARNYSGSKRSRSSPPSSRRSTIDSVQTEDYVLACCGELPESDIDDTLSFNSTPQIVSAESKASLIEKVQGQAGELEEVKHQLTSVLRELSNAEEELLRLRQRKADIAALEKQVEDLLQRAEETNKQRAKDAAELDNLKKRYVDEKARWERDINNAECELQCANERYTQLCAELSDSVKLVQRLREELSTSDDLIHRLRDELESVTTRLAAGIEENESLYRRLRELEGRSNSTTHSMREKARSVDSLSDLTNIDLDLDMNELDKDRVVEEYEDLRIRFEKAVAEIRAMKRELRESQAQTDCLELSLINARQEIKCKREAADAQTSLMAARIQDLALKLSNAEKQIRALKQKLSKTETREKRRSLSLKGRESFTICKELEDKLTELENKINSLDTRSAPPSKSISKSSNSSKSSPSSPESANAAKAAARLRRKSLDSVTSAEPMKVLLRLSSLEAKVAKAAKEIIISPSSPSPQPSSESVISNFDSLHETPVELKLFNGSEESIDDVDGKPNQDFGLMMDEIKKMENLLKSKLIELSQKRESLISSGQWTNEARINLLAEKLAYESVLISRLHDAVSECNYSDINDAERLMSGLDLKLSGGKPNIETSLNYLSRTLTRHLMEQKVHRIKPRKIKERRKAIDSPRINDFIKRKKTLDSKVGSYIDQVVDRLSFAFAVETLGDDSGISLENKIKATWTLAQEAVNQELIQAEISQVLVQCSKTYKNIVDMEKETTFVGLMKERAALEIWSSTAQDMLKREMETAVKQLHDRYQENILRLKTQKNPPMRTSEEQEEKTRELLHRFVDIVAHKALLDARMSLISDKTMSEVAFTIKGSDDMLFDESVILSEVQHLYVKFCEDLKVGCNQVNGNERKLKEALGFLIKEVSILKDCVIEAERKRRLDSDKFVYYVPDLPQCDEGGSSNWIENACLKCVGLKEQVVKLQTIVTKGKDCQRCYYLQDELKRRESQYDEEIRLLRIHQEQEVARLQSDLNQERQNLVCQHEQEQAMLKERARKLERRLGTLDSEYTQQMDNLRAAYHKTLSSTLDRDLQGEENIRQRYQAEIEHLRALCEKGLMGMENSHRRIISELEEKHRQELEALRLEKEQALTEETQATLAALDAMRKAHEAEVQKEISKFKTEFIKKLQSTHDIGALHKEHEAEMEEIKKEILSLSEKYSVKCVESAALEEELRVANSQLAQAQQHILQLDSRNKQLRAHLVSEASDSALDSQLLYQRERELHEKGKEVDRLHDQLASHGETLNALCAHLSNADHDKPKSENAIVAALTLVDNLKILSRNHCNSGSTHQSQESCLNRISKLDPSPLRTAELKRYPNVACGRSVAPLRSPSLCQISGMVAERKKLFEQ